MNTNLTDFYSEIARRADTPNQHIDVAEVSRVGSILFKVLAEKSTEEAMAIVAHGIQVAKSHQ